MREYELAAVFDLSLREADGPEASANRLKQHIESRGGKLLKMDHWGRRRMAYPIRHAIDADYVIGRFEAAPETVHAIETALRIDEAVFRHLIVRADELPTPPPPREPRAAAPAPAAQPEPAAAPPAEPEAPTAPAEAEAPAPVAKTAEPADQADESGSETAES